MRALLALALVVLSLVSGGCAGPAMGYKKMAEAAMSPLDVRAQAQDQRLKMQLRSALVENEAFAALGLTPAVYMQQGFVVGFVDNDTQGQSVVATANSVQGLRSVETYLPVKPAASTTEDDVTTKTEVKAAIALDPSLVSSRYTIEVLDGQVVLLGVVMSEEERQGVEKAAAGVGSVKGVTNFLLIVEQGYESLRPHLR